MAMLREVFQTKNRLALPMSGTGSAGMETCFVKCSGPGIFSFNKRERCFAHAYGRCC